MPWVSIMGGKETGQGGLVTMDLAWKSGRQGTGWNRGGWRWDVGEPDCNCSGHNINVEGLTALWQ